MRQYFLKLAKLRLSYLRDMFCVLNRKEYEKFKSQMKEWQYIFRTEMLERRVEPDNVLEMHMIKPTGIHEHLATLFMLTVERNLKIVLELGTRKGESTVALLLASKQIGGKVYSIDVAPCLEAKARIHTYGLEKYWVFIEGDDLKVSWDKTIDHLFIDTSHTFEQTLSELKKYEPYVKHGGVITLHDILSFPEVLQAVNVYIKEKPELRLYKYFNNNGLAVIFKGYK